MISTFKKVLDFFGQPKRATLRWLPQDSYPKVATQRGLPQGGYPKRNTLRRLPEDEYPKGGYYEGSTLSPKFDRISLKFVLI